MKVCLFAQYDRGPIPAHTLFYLDQLRDSGFTVHVACAGRVGLTEAEHAALGTCGATAWCRPNAGLDFGSWQYLMRQGVADGASTVLLANDSVFGPFWPLRPLFQEMNRAAAWGMVESRQQRRHLQSWFLCLSADTFAAPAVRRVFAQDFAAMSKDEIILHGEFGFSVALDAEGIAWQSRWSGLRRGWRSLPRRLYPGNPAHLDWLAMLQTGHVPFVKAELLRDNPMNVASVRHWRRHLPVSPGFDPDWINTALSNASYGSGAQRPVLNWKGRLAARLGAL